MEYTTGVGNDASKEPTFVKIRREKKKQIDEFKRSHRCFSKLFTMLKKDIIEEMNESVDSLKTDSDFESIGKMPEDL